MDDGSTTGWKRTLYASVVAQFFCMIGFSFAFPFIAFYIKDLGVTDPMAVRKWAGWVAAAAGFTMAVFAPIWGAVADRYGRKPMVLRSMFGAAAMIGLMAVARRPEHLVILRFIQGALSGTITANMVLVSGVTPAKHMGYAIGMIHAAAHAGRVVGPVVGGFVADHIGFRAAFVASSLFLITGGLLIKFFTHEPPPELRGAPEKIRGAYRTLFAISGFSVALLAMFQIQFATNLAAPLFPLFVEALRGTAEKAASITGVILTGNAVAAVFATGLLGRLSDKWGHKKMLLLTTACEAVLLILHAFAQNVVHLFVLRVLLGVAAAGVQPSASALIRSVVPDHSIGKAFGIMQSVRSMGMALGPLAGGYLSAQFAGIRGFQVPFLLTGVLLLGVPVLVGLFVHSKTPATRPTPLIADR